MYLKMGRDLFQIVFIIGQVPRNGLNNLDDIAAFLQETAKKKVCKHFGEHGHKSK